MLLKSCGTVYKSDAWMIIRYSQTHVNEQLTKLACSLSFPIEAHCENHGFGSQCTIKYVKTYQELSIRIRLARSQTSNLICIFLAGWILLHNDISKQRLSRQSSMKMVFDEFQENGQEKNPSASPNRQVARQGWRRGKSNPPSDAAPFTSLLNHIDVHYLEICFRTFAQLAVSLLSYLSSLRKAVCRLHFEIR